MSTRIPQRIESSDENDCIPPGKNSIIRHCLPLSLGDEKRKVFLYMLQTQLGDLFHATLTFSLSNKSKNIWEIQLFIRLIESIPPCTSLIYITENHLLFCASETGDHDLWRVSQLSSLGGYLYFRIVWDVHRVFCSTLLRNALMVVSRPLIFTLPYAHLAHLSPHVLGL